MFGLINPHKRLKLYRTPIEYINLDIHNQKDGFKCVEVCKKCYYPRKAIPDERAIVGGREITIENYINRKQSVREENLLKKN